MDVAVLGCGYVGLELGRQLVARGHDPVGVRRSDEGLAAIRDAGFDAVRADVTDPGSLAAVPDVDAVVFAASSGGRGADAAGELYVDGLRTAIDHFGERDAPPVQFAYTSSTGVYGDHGGGWVDEATPLDPTTEKTRVLAEAERVCRERAPEWGMGATVVRFAGLYGPERYRLTRYLDGPVTEGYLNMIHRGDAAGAVRFALTGADDAAADEGVAGEGVVGEGMGTAASGGVDRGDVNEDVLLAVDDEPVSKWAFADWLADECAVGRPEKRTVEERLGAGDLSTPAERRVRTSKRCSNDRFHELGYEFAFPTHREGYRPAIEAFRRGEYK